MLFLIFGRLSPTTDGIAVLSFYDGDASIGDLGALIGVIWAVRRYLKAACFIGWSRLLGCGDIAGPDPFSGQKETIVMRISNNETTRRQTNFITTTSAR